MLSLCPPDTPPRRATLDVPGGFTWWYADIAAPNGDALVLIGSWGLPFLPGYADAARRGAPERAGDRPSINLALYREGRLACYLLQEVPGTWETDGRWRFGESVLESTLSGSERRFVATIDCEVAGGGRLRGEVEIVGPARRAGPASAPESRDRIPGSGEAGARHEPPTRRLPGSGEGFPAAEWGRQGLGESAEGAHRWSVLTAPATGRARFDAGEAFRFGVEGRAYHDRNESEVPLDTLGIGEWIWGRAPLGDREVVWYLLWPADGGPLVAHGLELGPDGTTTTVPDVALTDASASIRRSGWYGLSWPETLRLTTEGRPWITVRSGLAVEDGPFYLRFLPWVEGANAAGERLTGRGVGELVRPDRVDLGWMRPFVRMRVRPPGAGASLWLPLFEGPREGRAGRLLQWAGRR